MIVKENSQKAALNAIENVLRKSVPLEDLQMTKVIQKFEETGLDCASSTRTVNLNKPIPNTFKMISTQANA